jgi:hypothetical protein
MKTALLFGLLTVLASNVVRAETNVRPLLDAICQVETSGGKVKTDGDGGKAIGPYQIWRVYWKDANLSGDYQQCRNKAYAERVVLAYWRRYAPEALAKGDFETLARIHNGGPAGANRSATVGYWRKVKSHLKK